LPSDGLTLPTLRVQGSAGIPALGTLRIDHVDTRRTADPTLFTGDPSPAPNADVSASPLTILPGATPNSAHLLLPRVVVHGTAGRHTAPALLDTGAEFIAVAPDSAARLQLVPLAAAATVGGVGTLTTRHVWCDAIEVGEARFVQVLGSALPLPALPALPDGAQAAGDRWRELPGARSACRPAPPLARSQGAADPGSAARDGCDRRDAAVGAAHHRRISPALTASRAACRSR
jgi:hypothetical protein